MHPDHIVQGIRLRTVGRYSVEDSVESEVVRELEELCPTGLTAHHVLRLHRVGRARAGWRTILVVVLGEGEQWRDVLRWAAAARQALPDPEAADLYLIAAGPGLGQLNAGSLEADEYFCRKVVLHPGEPLEHLLDRTFLARELPPAGPGTSVGDPLAEAIAALVTAGTLSATQAQSWRDSLIREPGGRDLADKLRNSLAEEADPQ